MIRTQDLRLLRWPLLLAAILIATGATAVWLAQVRAEAAERAHAGARQHYTAANTRLLQARTDEHTLRDALARYDALARQGVIGPERRLDWVETLDAARRRQGIDTISYEILPQQPVDKDAGERLRWMESRMRLTLQVRHAGVLLGLLDALREVDSALVLPHACRLARRADGAGLDGECELRWLTLQAGAPS
ncbi:hypothetical protein [Denitromonas iodatirespirans]|uniref:Uncharacterized protein n=1 Tax=Denitromonas iodatirespirans TaxID=2795389 RepID=A0A944H9Q3_DENI1|nr:hypothetical protein [Denitromonas iodatirespirans]MBT0962680.1 hypothetical protein [Denitromonas iodatirespirans]